MKTTRASALLVTVGTVLAVVPSASAALSARSYIQEGLIGHWDGEYNVGHDAAHSATATSWADLSGKGPAIPVPTGAAFAAKGLTTTRAHGSIVSGAESILACVWARKYTAEIAYTKTAEPSGGQWATLVKMLTLGKEGYWMGLSGTKSAGFQMIGEYWEAGLARGVSMADGNLGSHTFSCAQEGSSIRVLADDSLSRSDNLTQAAQDFTHGFRFNRSYYETLGLDGSYHDIRFYNRKLTSSEVKVNVAVDKVRFFGADPADCSLPAGWKFVTEGGDVTLQRSNTVSVTTGGSATVNGNPAPYGYWCEQGADASLTLVATPEAGYEFVRWDGNVEDAFKTDATATMKVSGDVKAIFRPEGTHKLTALSYITNGLVAHFDAEYNVSYTAAHNSSATAWKDLVGTASAPLAADWSFGAKALNTTRATGSLIANDGRMRQAFTSSCYTAEVAFDKTVKTVASSKGHKQRNGRMFTLGNDNFWLGFTAEKTPVRLGFTPSGSNGGGGSGAEVLAYVSPMETLGNHTLSCAHDGVKTYVHADSALTATNNYTAQAEPTQPHSYWINRGWYEDHGITGRYFSLRMYDRVLSADEVAVNQAVDQVRFFGADPSAFTLPTGWRFNETDGIRLERAVAVSVLGEGTVSSDTAWVVNNVTTPVNLTATPAEGHHFKRWLGAVDPADARKASGEIRISGPVTAEFVVTHGVMLILR